MVWRKTGFIFALAVVSPFIVVSPSSAAIVSCPGTVAWWDREFALITTVASTCLTYASGDLTGNNDVINNLGYVTLDKSNDPTSGALPGSLTAPTSGGFVGSFSFNAPGYASFVIALKSGENFLNPDWAAFLLPAGIVSGVWAIVGGLLSHAILYGVPTPTPLPGAVVLMGSVLAGSYGVGWWRRRRAGKAVAA